MGTVDAAVEDVIDAAPEVVAPIVCASVSGSRLQREIIEPVVGARQEFRIIDTQHDAECLYQAEDDGVHTCYPTVGETTTSIYYQDANCTSALARFTAAATPTKFTRYVRSGAMACAAPIQEYRVVGAASPVAALDAIFRRDTLGACVAISAPVGDYYVAGAALGADSFVSASTEAFSPETRISGLVYAGDDNSKMCAQSLLKVDSSLEVSCQDRFGSDGEAYCMPVGGTSSLYFTDALCQVGANEVAVNACQTPAPKYVVEDAVGDCSAVTRTVESVLPDEITTRYRLAGNNCKLEQADTNTYYSVGEAVADTAFATIALATEDLEGRLQRYLFVTEDRSAEFINRWYDGKLETDCVFRNAGDGSFRCLPLPMATRAFYTDVGCTIAIDLAVEGTCGAPVGFIARNVAMGRRIFAAKLYTPTVYELANTFCTVVSEPVYEENFEHAASSFKLGEIVLQ